MARTKGFEKHIHKLNEAKLKERIGEAEAFLAKTMVQSDSRTIALRHICEEAVDIAKGGLHAIDDGLPIAALVLNRALFERLVFAKWVAESDNNAARFSRASTEELSRQLFK